MLPELPRNMSSNRRIIFLSTYYIYTADKINANVVLPLVEYEKQRQRDGKQRVLLISGRKDEKLRLHLQEHGFTGVKDWYRVIEEDKDDKDDKDDKESGHYTGKFTDLLFPRGYFDLIIVEHEDSLIEKFRDLREMLVDSGILCYTGSTVSNPLGFLRVNTAFEKNHNRINRDKLISAENKILSKDVSRVIECIHTILGLKLIFIDQKTNIISFKRFRNEIFF
jgi:hypothetical protein